MCAVGAAVIDGNGPVTGATMTMILMPNSNSTNMRCGLGRLMAVQMPAVMDT